METIKKVQVENMLSPNGKEVPNQFRIITEDGAYFQSYSSVIAYKPHSGPIVLDLEKWDFSHTTGKYRNLFLRMDKKQTEQAIKDGRIILADLNT